MGSDLRAPHPSIGNNNSIRTGSSAALARRLAASPALTAIARRCRRNVLLRPDVTRREDVWGGEIWRRQRIERMNGEGEVAARHGWSRTGD